MHDDVFPKHWEAFALVDESMDHGDGFDWVNHFP
jgi:hypothetical protein